MAVAAGITFYEGGVGLVEDGVIEGGLAAWRCWRWLVGIEGNFPDPSWSLAIFGSEKTLKPGLLDVLGPFEPTESIESWKASVNFFCAL